MTLIEIKRKYPSCYYNEDVDAILIDGDDEPLTIAEDAKELIEEHYDGEKWDCMTSSGNPEDMVMETLTGKEYVEAAFYGDYNEAFEQA